MGEEEKELIVGILEFLKMEMKKRGLIFGVVINKVDPNESMLAICKKESLEKVGLDGIKISITELNKGLM